MSSSVSGHNPIPFLDLVTPHIELENELTQVFQQVVRTASFVGGSIVEDFERAFAQFCGTNHAVAVNSGTDALRFALIAAGVRPGDVVITVPNTFIATTEAITQSGSSPEFVDIDEQSYNMDPDALRNYLEINCTRDSSGTVLSKRSGRPVTAVVPVHLYGQCADMDSILDIAEEYGLIVVEDACQAHGSQYYSRKSDAWKSAGSMGKAAAFSFYPGKNLGACGEAGAVTTNDNVVTARVKMLRDHGQATKYYHDIEGYNGRLDAMQAGFLRVKLTHLPKWNNLRREAALRYNRFLSSATPSLIAPYEPQWSRANYHLYVVRTQNRDAMMKHLSASGIGTGIHYPIPLHLQKAYQSLKYRVGAFPIAEEIAAQIISLPMFPQLTSQQQEYIVARVAEFVPDAVLA